MNPIFVPLGMYQQERKIKAAFLMVVFALNTVVSFACSVGIVDFSKDHHKQDAQHSHNKPHSHDEVHHQTAEESDHQHSEPNHHSTGEEKGNCCSDDVIKLLVTDMAVTTTNPNPLPPSIELSATLHTFILSLYNKNEAYAKPLPPYLRWQIPATIPDLRIAIQSFQI